MEKLFYSDLEIKYTELINEYLQKGYNINTQTFAGHQGEICKIDLRHHLEPNNVIRILFDKTYTNSVDIYKILVLKYCEVDKKNTLWNERFDEVLQQNLYYEYQSRTRRSKIYLTNINDYNELTKIKDNRAIADGRYQSNEVDINSKIGQFIFRYCKRQSGYKGIKKSDISWIEKTKTGYVIYFPNMGYKKNKICIRYSNKIVKVD